MLEIFKRLSDALWGRKDDGNCCDVGDPRSQDTPCIHMEIIFKCHYQNGDTKPENCSITTCPAYAQECMRASLKEIENARMFS